MYVLCQPPAPLPDDIIEPNLPLASINTVEYFVLGRCSRNTVNLPMYLSLEALLVHRSVARYSKGMGELRTSSSRSELNLEVVAAYSSTMFLLICDEMCISRTKISNRSRNWSLGDGGIIPST